MLNDRIKFSNEFDVLSQKKAIHELGEGGYGASQVVKCSSQGILGKSELYRVFRRDTEEIG